MKILLILFSTLFISRGSLAQKYPLYFPPNKNNVQVLTQKFEYGLLDADKIRVGDVLIDTKSLRFDLIKSNSSTFRLSFRWPAGILTEGLLSLMNNNGKAIWSKEITTKQVKVTKVDAAEGDDTEGIRNEIAEYISDEISDEILNDMKMIPFINFCVSRLTETTKIYLCSQELYLSKQENQFEVKARSSGRKVAEVEINSKTVNPQGVIYLNDTKENLYLKATAESGAHLEVETRMQEVDFKDMIVSNDGKTIQVIASGTQPVDEKMVKKLNETDWQANLSMDRPMIYLKGAGGIPLLQEFLVKGSLPMEKHRPHVKSKLEKTYSSSINLSGSYPTTVRLHRKQENGRVESEGKNKFNWTLENLKKNEHNQRYLTIDGEGNKFVARYDIERGQPFQALAGARYFSSSGIAFGYAQLQWWLDWLHWGMSFEYEKYFNKKDSFPDIDTMTAELLFRFNSGFLFESETWGLGIPISQMKADSGTITAVGVSFWGHRKWNGWISDKIIWHQPRVFFYSGGGTSVKLKSAYGISDVLYYNIGESKYVLFGLHAKQWKFDPEYEKEPFDIGIETGISFFF